VAFSEKDGNVVNSANDDGLVVINFVGHYSRRAIYFRPVERRMSRLGNISSVNLFVQAAHFGSPWL
jgi:hypothetical protein